MNKIFLTLFLLVFVSCHRTIIFDGKRSNYFRKTNSSSNYLKFDYNTSFDTNIKTVVNLEELIYMDDIEFDIIKSQKTNRKIAQGRKFFAKNNISDKIFEFDDKNLLTNIGICRSKLLQYLDDLQDDGVINGSTASDSCFVKARRPHMFSKGNMTLKEVSFLQLEDWAVDDFKDAMNSFLNSCTGFQKRKQIASQTIKIGTPSQWLALCKIAQNYQKIGFERMFFERYFSPFMLIDNRKANGENGLFTGYYLWEINASKVRSDKYWYPVYRMPQECRPDKCYSRAEINDGILQNRGLEIVWCDNVYDVYSMQVQGSGIGIFENGETIRIGFAGKNGLPFKSISDAIKRNDELKTKCSGYSDIFDCLKNDHYSAIQVTNETPSYVFFKELENGDVIGAQGVPLTQSRSIAVDPQYIPYGVPIWIETNLPIKDADKTTDDVWLHFNRLWMAQDTGSAIKGVVRADLYMGYGRKGEFIAKNMKFGGRAFMLIPNAFVDSLL